MLNLNFNVDRSVAGEFTQVLDLTTHADILAADLILFRIDDKVAASFIKRNSNLGGSDAEVAFNVSTDDVTVKLTEQERQTLPDAGLNYKLYVGEAVKAYGNVTASGVPPADADPPVVLSFYNGDRDKTITADYSLNVDDDIIYAVPAALGSLTITAPSPGNFYKTITKEGKSFRIKNKGEGDVNLNYGAAEGALVIVSGDTVEIRCTLDDQDDPYWEKL